MDIPDDLAGRLRVALKIINLSPAALGAVVGVDKSVVSRWLSGKVVPNGHNLSRIGAEIARHRAGFSTLSFEEPAQVFLAALGMAPPGAVRETAEALPLPYGALDVARRETARRGVEYYGHYAMYCWSFTRPGRIARMALMLRPSQGLIAARYGAAGIGYGGWALLMMNRLYVQLSEERHEAMTFLVTNPGQPPKTQTMTGLLMGPSDRPMLPTVSPVVMLREADVTGDETLDAAEFHRRQAFDPIDRGEAAPPAVRATLLRQVAVTPAADGTLALLQARDLSAEA